MQTHQLIEWHCPQWPPDFGDPMLEFKPLKALSERLMAAAPATLINLENPEPGLLFVHGESSTGTTFEVYSVASGEQHGSRRLGVFAMPAGSDEIEEYFDSPDDAAEFLLSLLH